MINGNDTQELRCLEDNRSTWEHNGYLYSASRRRLFRGVHSWEPTFSGVRWLRSMDRVI